MPDSAPLSSPVPEVTTGPFPSSRKVHVSGRRHADIRVAMREIDLEPSAGEPPVRVYDTSGIYSDPAARDRHPHRSAGTAPPVDLGARRCRADRRPRDQAGG